MDIPDPNFSSRIQGHKDSGSRIRIRIRIRIKEINYSLPKIWSGDVHPGSGSWFCTHHGSRILIFYPSQIPDPGAKKAPVPDPQHCFYIILILSCYWKRIRYFFGRFLFSISVFMGNIISALWASGSCILEQGSAGGGLYRPGGQAQDRGRQGQQARHRNRTGTGTCFPVLHQLWWTLREGVSLL